MIRLLRRLLGLAPDPRSAAAAFRRQADVLREQFFEAAAATGKPRGLSWVSVEPVGEPVFAWDRPTGRLLALVPVVVRFEPEPGSEMEGVAAAREPRPVTAVFRFAGRDWVPDPKPVFNLSPGQVVERSGGRYERVEA